MPYAELLLPREREKKPYRLRCRFKVHPHPTPDYLHSEKVRVAERFVADMHTQGWEYVPKFGFTMKGPFAVVEPVTIHVLRLPPAREMLARVRQGERFLASGQETQAAGVTPLQASEAWEYELAGVFIRPQIMTERPDAHEERPR